MADQGARARARRRYRRRLIWLITSERAETLDVLNQAPDPLQLRAEERVDRDEQAEQQRIDAFYRDHDAQTIRPQRASVGLAWFPDAQYQRALETRPSFAEDYEHGPYASYCARLELLLRDLRAQGVPRLALTPITIDDYLSWCTEHDREPEQSDTRASYASELLEHDTTRHGRPNATSHAGAEAAASTRSAAYARADPKPQLEIPCSAHYLLGRRPRPPGRRS